VSQFLVDAYPSHLLPATGSIDAAWKRARINFFVDTWNTKANTYWHNVLTKDSEEEKEQLVKDLISTVSKEIEPLLQDAAPFFGGSSKLTLAEVITAPFILRIYTFAKHGLLPKSLITGFEGLPNFSRWAAEVQKHESVTYIWDEELQVENLRKRIAKIKAETK